MSTEIKLGDLVEDRITGFSGVVECISEWLNSCKRLTIRPLKMKDGVPLDNRTFDSPQLIVLEAGYYDRPVFKKEEKTGGPSITPNRAVDPV